MYKIPANLGFASNLVHYLPSCHSTNQIAANLLKSGTQEGSVVITDNQTNGAGQRGNEWNSEPFKNLTFSLVLKPSFLEINHQFFLTQIISISMVNVLQKYVASLVKIKWPNDIYIGDKKVAGILIQNSVKGKQIESTVVGIGCNINQVEFGKLNATSLQTISRKNFNLNEVLVESIKEISNNYRRLQDGLRNEIEDDYLSNLLGINELRKFRYFKSSKEFEGKIIGVDNIGKLLIEMGTGVESFQNQEVKFVFN